MTAAATYSDPTPVGVAAMSATPCHPAFAALLGGTGSDDTPIPFGATLLWPGLPLTGTLHRWAALTGRAPLFGASEPEAS